MGDFDLGRVITRTFSAIGKNWALFLGCALVLVGIPSLIMTWGQANMMSGMASAIAAFGVGFILFLVGFYLLQGMMLKVAVNGFNGKTTPFDRAFDVGVRSALPLLGLAIVAGLGLMIGFALLIVPGVFLMVMWVVAAPVLVAERRDIFASLKRSAALTKGRRWSVFGLLVIYLVLSWIISAAVGAVLFATGSITPGAPNAPVMMGINFVVNILQAVIAAAGAASLYYELRTSKEGGGAEELAAVFD